MTQAVVQARGVSKQFRGRSVLHDVSCQVQSGDVVGVLGKNGAGKTTLLEILLGFSPASAGRCELFGEPSFALPAATKARIGFIPQQDELIDSLTGSQQLQLSACLHARWNTLLIESLVRIWNVPLDRPIQNLSPGERQKLSALLALGHEPELLVFDEPAASLDPVARRQFIAQLLEMVASQARTVLFSSHIVSDLERVANRIWILREGTIAWQGALDELKESVVRLHLRAPQVLGRLDLPGVLSQRLESNRAVVVVGGWDEARAQVWGRWAQSQSSSLEVETLNLEDIFLELHS